MQFEQDAAFLRLERAMHRARRTAVDRLATHAQELGGNAVLGVRFDTSDIGDGMAEVVAYGTAAVVRAS